MTREEARQKAKELVSKMTLEEKAGQLRYDALPIKNLDIPAYNWWNEGLHGVARAGSATVFPQAIGMAATFDEEMIGEMAQCVATEGRAKYNENAAHNDRDIYKGLTFWSPNVNIFRDPRWGRGHETYGEDPYLTSRLGVSYVKNLQGDGEYMKAAACAKHYAVHSGPEAVRHEFDVCPSKKDLEDTYLPAFEALVTEADVESVMGAYNRVYGAPCAGSDFLINDILRGKWGFKGHFVSDCWAIRDFHENHGVTKTVEESAAMAINTGCDLNCGNTYLHMLKAVKDGLVKEETITESVERLYTTRFLLGLFDDTEFDEIPYEKVECKEHVALADKATLESVVLLKNDGLLPLQKDVKTIGVIGPNANSRAALIGNYHGTSSEYVTISEGLQEYVRENGLDTRILYADGCALFQDRTEPLAMAYDRIAEAKAVAEHSDVVVLVVGLDETLEGEEGDTGNSYASGDKESLLLPESQMRLMKAIAEVGKPVVLLNMTGSAMDLSFANERFGAIMQLWYPGARGGRGVAKLLFGDASPSGKLPVTFYNTLEELPAFEDYTMKGRTYRYMENAAQYPFGYGLTYGDVAVDSVQVESADKDQVVVKVKATNNSDVATDDVLQLYLKALDTTDGAPNPSLCSFKRIHLGAKESGEYTMTIQGRALTVVNEEGVRAIVGKRFCLYAGTQQPDAMSEKLTGHSCKKVEISL